ncbi:uncharacterized protein N0V96_005533 [Colletotrichum fioriniae]|uniref:uncharacterized protein n=1 Tax=Colletotrichum fioriniae TaxID=710243 RepID=UPI0032DB6A33|nr:hypothetical protein N0V96_005533 [Colletotrichum fioriniae]
MPSSNPNPERSPAPAHLPAAITDTNPFYIDMSQGTHRKALQPFTFTSILTRRKNTHPRPSHLSRDPRRTRRLPPIDTNAIPSSTNPRDAVSRITTQ